MQNHTEISQCVQSLSAEQPRASQINEQIENALSLLANNPAVSEEVVRTIRDIYTSHTQSGASASLKNSDRSPVSEEEGVTEETGKLSEIKPDIESAGEQSSEEDSSVVHAIGAGSSDGGKRLHLTEEQVIEIYNLRPQYGRQGRLRRGSMLRCKTIAPRYGVTPKTIRDIWCGRTWPQTTEHLWTDEERAARQSLRKPDALRGHDVKQALEDLRVSFLGASTAPPAMAAAAAIPSPPLREETTWAAAAAAAPRNSGRPASKSSTVSIRDAVRSHEDSAMARSSRPSPGMGTSEWLSRLADSAAAAAAASASAGAVSGAHSPISRPHQAALKLKELSPRADSRSESPPPAIFPVLGQPSRPLLPPLRLGHQSAAIGDTTVSSAGAASGRGLLPPSAESPGLAGALSLLEGLYGSGGGGGGGGSGGGGGEAHSGLLRSFRDAVQLSLLWTPPQSHSAPAAAAAAAAAQAALLPPLRFVPGGEPASPAGSSGLPALQSPAAQPRPASGERPDSKRRRQSGEGAPANG